MDSTKPASTVGILMVGGGIETETEANGHFAPLLAPTSSRRQTVLHSNESNEINTAMENTALSTCLNDRAHHAEPAHTSRPS
jgi:hypothetical protein